MLALFLLGFIGFSVDFSNLWFHRQAAQAAADAACQAGAMNMLVPTATRGFNPGTAFDCASTPGAVPCKYAALNGYPSGGLTTGDSNLVSVSFPLSVPTVPSAKVPPVGLAPTVFIRVDVVDRVRVFFAALLAGSSTRDVRATAKCGLILANSPIPIVVLHPTKSGSLTILGTPAVNIRGGPTRSVQVNSTSTTSVNYAGSGSLIDLSLGGPAGPPGTGSDLGVQGGMPNPCPPNTPTASCGNFNPGSTGHWIPASAITDPFAQMLAPGVPPSPGTKTAVSFGTNGCPDPAGCDEYTPGHYTSTLQVKNATAIFDPGIYYLDQGLDLASNSTVRPSTVTGSGDGTVFYFSGSTSVAVDSNSGKKTFAKDGILKFDTTQVKCPAGAVPTGLPATVEGNILLGICSGPYGDPLGQYRGMLFFQDRSGNPTGPNAPNWGGGGQFVLAGNMYFHQCNSSDGAGLGTTCNDSTGFNDVFSLCGNSGSGTYVLGDIITDQLTLCGTSAINMNLNPTAAFNVLKVQLLQ